jgi:hypothetical protein
MEAATRITFSRRRLIVSWTFARLRLPGGKAKENRVISASLSRHLSAPWLGIV